MSAGPTFILIGAVPSARERQSLSWASGGASADTAALANAEVARTSGKTTRILRSRALRIAQGTYNGFCVSPIR